ncbi:hypothetical protein HanIR_Chr08g0365741 [Helianthus annuus]|nr:hypothetical protein HanIR_Chr08g0365741 [Helianthus annuus]
MLLMLSLKFAIIQHTFYCLWIQYAQVEMFEVQHGFQVVGAAYKPLDISNEAIVVLREIQKDRWLGPAFVRVRCWSCQVLLFVLRLGEAEIYTRMKVLMEHVTNDRVLGRSLFLCGK